MTEDVLEWAAIQCCGDSRKMVEAVRLATAEKLGIDPSRVFTFSALGIVMHLATSQAARDIFFGDVRKLISTFGPDGHLCIFGHDGCAVIPDHDQQVMYSEMAHTEATMEFPGFDVLKGWMENDPQATYGWKPVWSN